MVDNCVMKVMNFCMGSLQSNSLDNFIPSTDSEHTLTKDIISCSQAQYSSLSLKHETISGEIQFSIILMQEMLWQARSFLWADKSNIFLSSIVA